MWGHNTEGHDADLQQCDCVQEIQGARVCRSWVLGPLRVGEHTQTFYNYDRGLELDLLGRCAEARALDAAILEEMN